MWMPLAGWRSFDAVSARSLKGRIDPQSDATQVLALFQVADDHELSSQLASDVRTAMCSALDKEQQVQAVDTTQAPERIAAAHGLDGGVCGDEVAGMQ
jgi:hypothetical protein